MAQRPSPVRPPRAPRAPASRLALPPARAAFAVLMLCCRPSTITLAAAPPRPRASFAFVFGIYRKRLLLSQALVKPNLWWQRKAVRAGRGPGILAATDQSVVETSLTGFPATPPNTLHARACARARVPGGLSTLPLSPPRPKRFKKVWARGTVTRGEEPKVHVCEHQVLGTWW